MTEKDYRKIVTELEVTKEDKEKQKNLITNDISYISFFCLHHT